MNLLFIMLDALMDFGITVTLVGFGIVLFSLALLFILFAQIPKIINRGNKKKATSKQKNVKSEPENGIEGNVTAAVSLALHLYFNEQHDEESNIVTIKQVRRAYSPWSSKIYSVTNNWPRA